MTGHVGENDRQWGGGKLGWRKGWPLVGRTFRMSYEVL